MDCRLKMKGKIQAKQILIALDQLTDTLLVGHADETLSARAYRLSRDRGRHWPRRVIDALFFWEPGHCEQAHLSELLRRHLPRQYRDTQ